MSHTGVVTTTRYMLFVLSLTLFALPMRADHAIVGATVTPSLSPPGFGSAAGSRNAAGLIPQVASGCSEASFAQGSPLDVGHDTGAMVVGDFNRDGSLDLAVSNRTNNNVTILLGNSLGGFTQPAGSPVGVGMEPTSIEVGDFNLDGKPDLAVSNRSSNNITILLGDGSGGFSQPAGSPIGVGTNPYKVASADLNLDGKPDLAVVNAGSDNATILLGNGNGGFAQASGSPVAAGTAPVFVVVVDLNRDGKPDLATTNGYPSYAVTVLLGNGAGGFVQGPGSPWDVADAPESIAVGDFNLDGKPDLAVASFGQLKRPTDNGITRPSSGGAVTILVGDGNGGFTQPPGSVIGAGDYPKIVVVGDFNLDGKPDVAVSNLNFLTTGFVMIRYGDGNAGFTSATIVGTSFRPAYIVGADFNRDGKPDLAGISTVAGVDNLILQLNTCNAFPCPGAGFIQPGGSPIGVGTAPQSVAVGDFNLDGKSDFAAVNADSDNVTIQLGNGNGGFTQAAGSPVVVGDFPVSGAVGDFNLDGKPDLAVANNSSSNVSILLGNGSGGFTQAAGSPVAAGTFPNSAAVGDFNLDGKPDLALTNQNNVVTILLGNGSGGFAQAAGSPVGAGSLPDSVAVGDFNLDGKPDLAVANNVSNNVTILLGNSSGGFTQAAGSPVGAGGTPVSIKVGDFNQDGNPDLVVANAASNNVTILLGNGSGGFTQPAGSPVGAGTFPLGVAVGDFNIDGKPDLAVANNNSNNLTIQLGNGAGGFTQPAGSPINTGTFLVSVAVGDFDLDGKPDLAMANQSNTVQVLLNTCSNTQLSSATTIGLFRSSGNRFLLRNSNTAGSPDITVAFGASGDIPIVGDWDGNGTVTIGLYRPGTSTFYLRNNNTPGFPDITVPFGDGAGGDIPISGDWDGNGTWTIGVYRPGSSTFYLRNSNTPGFPDISVPYGAPGDLPVVGDWDGNGTTTIGLYRPGGSIFYLRNSNTVGFPDLSIPYGAPGDTPMVGDWDGNGSVTIGLYRPGGSIFYLRNTNTTGFPDITVPYGASGDKPLAGNWDGQ